MTTAMFSHNLATNSHLHNKMDNVMIVSLSSTSSSSSSREEGHLEFELNIFGLWSKSVESTITIYLLSSSGNGCSISISNEETKEGFVAPYLNLEKEDDDQVLKDGKDSNDGGEEGM